ELGAGQTPAAPLAPAAATSELVEATSALGEGPSALRSWTELARMVRTYRYGVMEAHLYPFPWGAANAVYHVGTLGLAIIGWLIWLRTKWRSFALLFTGAYASMLLVAPVWAGRYVWLVHPVLAMGLVSGLSWAVGFLRPGVSPGRRAFVGGLLISGLVAGATWSAAARSLAARPPDADAWRSIGSALQSEDPRARVASNRPRKLTWYSGVPAMGVVPRRPGVWLAEMERLGVSHVVIDTSVADRWLPGIRDSLATYPEYFPRLRSIDVLVVHGVRQPEGSPTP
ncbi:MAG: hypothetical protein MJB57_01785, partial [Gemmatimonadetes bacterium]|nr:hypothetical protein [Gemmatimonadota bacterium]